jgi:hypothetical protein
LLGEEIATKRIVVTLMSAWLAMLPAYAQGANKLRVLAAPGVVKNKPKDWRNNLSVAGSKLVLSCPKCLPIQAVITPKAEVVALRYGQNAYHHWAAGIVTGIFSLGIGAIVGFWPHHQHFFSVDLKSGRVEQFPGRTFCGNSGLSPGPLRNVRFTPMLGTG